MPTTTRVAGLVLLASLAFGAVAAAPTTFYGEDQTPGGVVPPDGNAAKARASFLSLLVGVDSQGFEGYDKGLGAPLTIAFAGGAGQTIGATLDGRGSIADDPVVGRFNTTPGGSKWWEVGGEFSIAFDRPISAFGFYGTDIGDFGGDFSLRLTPVGGGAPVDLTVRSGADVVPNGGLLFFGFIDLNTAYTGISFLNSQADRDFFGFDDMVVGERVQVIPEPSTALLWTLGLLGLPLLRRR